MSEDGYFSNALFDLAPVQVDSPRLVQLRDNDIQTHHSPKCEIWYAVPMKIARDFLSNSGVEGEFDSIMKIMIRKAWVLEDAGLVFTGDSKESLESEALAFALGMEKSSNKTEIEKGSE